MRGGCGLRVVGWLHRLNRRPKVREDRREAGWLLIVRALHPLINADCLNLGPSSSVLTILPLQSRVVVGRRRRRGRRILSGMLTRAGIVGILRVYRLVPSTPFRIPVSEEEFSPFSSHGRKRKETGGGGGRRGFSFEICTFRESVVFFFLFFFSFAFERTKDRNIRGYFEDISKLSPIVENINLDKDINVLSRLSFG